MILLEEIVLITGIDIPFFEARAVIHQPTLKEIAYLGEKKFFLGCELLTFSKDSLSEEDKVDLKDKTNFDIILSILREKGNIISVNNGMAARGLLRLLFPTCEVYVGEDSIILRELDPETAQFPEHVLDNSNFDKFQKLIKEIFQLKTTEKTYNPQGDLAKKIADKLNRGKQRLAELNARNELTKVSILSRYASILAVGMQKDINVFSNYTVFQLYDEFNRFELYEQNDTFIRARLAGAKDVEQPPYWKKDLYED